MNDEATRLQTISELTLEWREKKILDRPDKLVEFVRERENLSDETRRLAAQALVAEDFRAARRERRQIWIERQEELFSNVFEKAGLPLDRLELLQLLVQADVETTEHAIERDDLVERFPEIADFIDRFFSQYRSRIRSINCRVEARNREFVDNEFADRTRDEGEKVLLTDNYRIVARLGAGGQKDVYEALQESTGQRLALKELRSRYADSVLFRSQMREEAILQTRLTHPNIPQILTLGDDGKLPVFVERLVPGTDWGRLAPKQTLEENVELLLAVSRIVAFAHERKRIVHGDLKPENVMLGERGGRYNEVYLVDWGLAIDLDDPNLDEKTFGGTVEYMPPEGLALSAKEVSPATDVFMLGGILYKLLTGKAPYEERYLAFGQIGALEAVAKVEIASIPVRNEKTGVENPTELIEIAKKALQKEPRDRYPDGDAFAEALEKYRRRANLGERLRQANESFATLRERQENQQKSRSGKAAILTMELVEITNEFRLLRKETADGSETTNETSARARSPLFWRAAESERLARELLLETALTTRDFGLVAAQLNVAEELELELRQMADAQSGVGFESNIFAFRAKLERGLAARRRDRAMKWIAAVAACAVVALTCLGIWLSNRALKADRNALAETSAREREEAKNQILGLENEAKNKENEYLRTTALEKEAATAQAERFGQGALAIYGSIEAPERRSVAANVLYRTALLPEAQSACQRTVESAAFSTDEKYFATLDDLQCVDFYRVDDLTVVFRTPRLTADGKSWLVANPCFCDEKSEDAVKSSRFLFFQELGAAIFLSFDENRDSETLDFNEINARVDSPVWGKPIFLTQGDEIRTVAPDAQGNLLIFSFPDGKLLKSVAASASTMNVATNLVASADGKTFVSAGADGSYKRWSADGELLEEIALPFPKNVDLNVGFVRPLDLSPDGKLLVAGCETGQIVVWDVEKKETILETTEPENPEAQKALGFDDKDVANFIMRTFWLDSRRFITLGLNDRYLVWDLDKRDANGEPTRFDFQSPDAFPKIGVRLAVLSPSKKLLLVAENRLCLSLFETDGGKKIATSEGVRRSITSALTTSCVAYSRASDKILAGTFGYRPLISFDPSTLRVATEYFSSSDVESVSDDNYISSIAVREDDSEFAAAATSGELLFFNGDEPKPIATKPGVFNIKMEELGCLGLIAASPDGKYLLGTEVMSDELILWDWKTRDELRRWKKIFVDADGAAALSAANATLLIEFYGENEALEIKQNGSVVRWNVETGETLGTSTVALSSNGSGLPVRSFRLSNSRRLLALGFLDGTIAVLDVAANKTILAPTREPSRALTNVGASTDSFGVDLSPTSGATGIDWSQDDGLLCVGFSTGKFALLETRFFTTIAVGVAVENNLINNPDMSLEPFFTRDGKLLMVGSNGILTRWDFQPSPEKATVLKREYGADQIVGTSRPGRWAGIRRLESQGFPFFLFENDREIFRRDNVEDFQRASAPSDATEIFLLLGKDGALTCVDENGETVPNSDAYFNAGAPRRGFIRIAVSPNRRWIAGIEKNGRGLYWFDRQDVAPEWRKIENLTGKFVQTAFRPDSLELALVDDVGGVSFVASETARPSRFLNRGLLNGPIALLKAGAIAYTKSGKFLIQVGDGVSAIVWNVEKRTIAQKISLNLFERFSLGGASVNGLAILDRGLQPNADGDAFVVAGNDGVLRFYSFDDVRGEFTLDYVVSSLTLSEMIGEKKEAEEAAGEGRYDQLFDDEIGEFAADESFDEETVEELKKAEKALEQEQTQLETQLARLTMGGASLEGQESLGNVNLVVSDRFWINALATSDDGKTLYVGASGEARAYDLDEIRRNVEIAPEFWKSVDFETKTGLQYFPGLGLRSIERNRMISVESR